MFKVSKTKFKDLLIFEGEIHKDKRGYLRELIVEKNVKKRFKFQIISKSKKNVLRGFHFQYKHQQSKLITVIKGKVLDCVIDLRKNSRTFGKIFSIILSENNCKSLYVPRGFAHAYFSIQKMNVIYYKLSNYYDPKFEDGICYSDKDVNAKWPKTKLIVSKKDKLLGSFQNFKIKHKGL